MSSIFPPESMAMREYDDPVLHIADISVVKMESFS